MQLLRADVWELQNSLHPERFLKKERIATPTSTRTLLGHWGVHLQGRLFPLTDVGHLFRLDCLLHLPAIRVWAFPGREGGRHKRS